MVPLDTDICICLDLDEVLLPGWREKLEQSWDRYVTRARYNYNWSLDEKNNPLVNFYIEKIHKRDGYKWIHPVHEILKYSGEEKIITIDNLTVNHYPDYKKSRSSYLGLLELSVKEEPNDDRNMHYLGREYMYYGRYNECIDTLIKHLKMPNAIWKDERCASMRFIARSYKMLKRYDEAKMWLNKAIIEAPYLRDPFIERALLAYELAEWDDVIKYTLEALKIKNHPKTYINEPFSFNETPYDLLSIAYFYTKNYQKALEYVNLALLKSNDERILKNKQLIEKALI